MEKEEKGGGERGGGEEGADEGGEEEEGDTDAAGKKEDVQGGEDAKVWRVYL